MQIEIQIENGDLYPDDLIVTKLICDGNDIINVIPNQAYDKIHEIFFNANFSGDATILLTVVNGKITHSSIFLDPGIKHALEIFFQETAHVN